MSPLPRPYQRRHRLLSNGCATTPSVSLIRRLILLVHTFAAILAMAELARHRSPLVRWTRALPLVSIELHQNLGQFPLGLAARLGAHESGHLLFDAHPRLETVLDLVSFYHPDQRWAAWGSRAATIGGVAVIAR